jgi:hypothetical protein
MREGQKFVMHLGIWKKETEVDTWSAHGSKSKGHITTFKQF